MFVHKNILVNALLVIVLVACNNNNQNKASKNAADKTDVVYQSLNSAEAEKLVDEAINNDEFKKALAIVNQNSDLDVADLLREKIHLNYGLYYEYRSKKDMRTRMNQALRQFIYTLEVNKNNQKARAEIDQIMGVYATMPNRQPEEGIVDTLESMKLIN